MALDGAFFHPEHQGIKCYAVALGGCWLAMEGVNEPLALRQGDCFLLPHGRPFRLTSDLAVTPVGYGELRRDGDVRSWNGGGECLIVGGHFELSDAQARHLLGALTPVVHLHSEEDRSAMRWALDRMRLELSGRQLGASLMVQQLAQMILIQAFRRHTDERGGDGAGWLFALADPQLRRAVEAIHADPARRWTVAELAREAGASRSSFARRFAERLRQSPIEYLTLWRMMLAADRLKGGETTKVVALSLGYGSDSAFCASFRRVMGSSPSKHSRMAATSSSHAHDESATPPLISQ